MKAVEYLAEQLALLGVTHVFGYQGANVTILIDAIAARDDMNFVQAYHEQASSFEANGYSQSSGRLGVAVSSSGPGALNLITGIANAYCDAIPCLFICGDLSKRFQKTELPMRQNGFQAIDIVSMVSPITKYAAVVSDPRDLISQFQTAVKSALSGRQGPVLLSIPHWIQRAELPDTGVFPVVVDETMKFDFLGEPARMHVVESMNASKKPLILIGGGTSKYPTKQLVAQFIRDTGIPAVASLQGLSTISHDSDEFIGFIGDYGNSFANYAIEKSDLLLVLGSRMDERQVGFMGDGFESKKIVHVDFDDSELRSPTDSYLPVQASIVDFLRSLEGELELDSVRIRSWVNRVHRAKVLSISSSSGGQLNPDNFIKELTQQLKADAQIFVDVGLHQMCVAQSAELSEGQTLHFSGGLGAMSYSISAAVGGKFAKPDAQTVVIVGDGGFMMGIHEIQTIARENLNIKIFVFNNKSLGMVRDHQISALEGRTVGTVKGYEPGNFEKIASSYGLLYFKMSEINDLGKLEGVLSEESPTLIEVVFPDDITPINSDWSGLEVSMEASEGSFEPGQDEIKINA